jgi:hypothetical protein
MRHGAPGEIRTPDLQLRRLPLYPAELRARISSLHVTALNAQVASGLTLDTVGPDTRVDRGPIGR